MTKLLRRTLLVSSTALMAITLIPTLGTIVPGPLAALVASEAQARGGDDDDDDSGSESDDSGRDSDSDRDDSDDDSSGRDRSDDDDDDDDDNSGRGSDDDDDDDDSDDDEDDDSNRRGRGGDRDEIRLIVNDNQLQGLLNGSMIPVDQNGKRLRYEVEQEHGQTEIKLRAPKGTLTGVTVIPAP
jgi:type IV secretory pathway VirB10-like protein